MTTYKSLGDGLAALVRDAKSRLNAKVRSDLAEFMANDAVAIILKRTRRGYGVERTGATIVPLRSLAPTYIDFRRRTRRRLSAFTTPTKSNLTYSGELLYSLGNRRKSDGSYIVTAQGNRSDGKTNRQVARWVSRVRPFLNLSKGELDQILKSARKKFKSLAK